MNATDIRNRRKALPELPVVHADSMIYAQAVRLDPEQRAAIAEHRRFYRDAGVPATVALKVYNRDGAVIGTLRLPDWPDSE